MTQIARTHDRERSTPMAEMSTPENDELVGRVYTQALEARAEGRQLDAAETVVYEIEMLSQEVNSGASFEQYFRWASVAEVSRVVERLESIGLPEVAQLTRTAIDVAFPDGLPGTDDEKDDLTAWTEDQEERLTVLADAFAEFNGRIINVLGAFYRKSRGGG
jgi:hypothetical protein